MYADNLGTYFPTIVGLQQWSMKSKHGTDFDVIFNPKKSSLLISEV